MRQKNSFFVFICLENQPNRTPSDVQTSRSSEGSLKCKLFTIKTKMFVFISNGYLQEDSFSQSFLNIDEEILNLEFDITLSFQYFN